MRKCNIIAISGTTASGKNDLAISLAKKFGGIIINADSKQIYKELNIATAKPIPKKIKKDGTWYIDDVAHYLYSFVSVKNDYNVYKYQKDVESVINRTQSEIVYLVGGTGLYLDSIMYGYKLPIHQTYTEDLNALSLESLQEKLGEDLKTLNESDRSNRRRLISHLKRRTEGQREKTNSSLYLYLDIDKETVNQRIEDRVNLMFENGIEQENREIYEKYKDNLPSSLQIIGFSEFIPYFKSEISIEQVKELIIIHTRQYAKRQRTWFKRNKDIEIVNDFIQASYKVSNFLSSL